jgi:hypothetical protein
VPGRLDGAHPPGPTAGAGPGRVSTAAAGLRAGTSSPGVEAWWRSLWVPPPSSDRAPAGTRGRDPWSEGEVTNFSDEETAAVLRDLGEIQLELQRTAPAKPSAVPGEVGHPDGSPQSGSPSGAKESRSTGTPSLYLDERLARARVAASNLGQELHRVEEDSHGLRESIDRIEGDLGQAVEELAFIRSNEWGDPPPILEGAGRHGERASVRSGPGGLPLAGAPASAGAPPSPRPPVSSAPFEEFTSKRYNRTVGGLHRRWPRVVWITLLLSAAITLALEVVLLLSREPFPALWLALLPVIWMLPVPFFVAAFRGTHRVLRETPLALPEQP